MRKQLDASLTEKEKGSNTDSDISGLDRKGQGGTKHEERHEWQSGQQPFSPTQCVDAPHSWQGTQKVDGACRAVSTLSRNSEDRGYTYRSPDCMPLE
jgi:hypothetical protein